MAPTHHIVSPNRVLTYNFLLACRLLFALFIKFGSIHTVIDLVAPLLISCSLFDFIVKISQLRVVRVCRQYVMPRLDFSRTLLLFTSLGCSNGLFIQRNVATFSCQVSRDIMGADKRCRLVMNKI